MALRGAPFSQSSCDVLFFSRFNVLYIYIYIYIIQENCNIYYTSIYYKIVICFSSATFDTFSR